jgi:prepilin-type N-terminal cleavage/methylation domain-containing protein/prepilin-type processing-associated H-X9-DG protein
MPSRSSHAEHAGPGSQVRPNAFTLVELLVVIAIIALLIGLLLPAVQSARESARRTQCQNNLRQLSLGAISYCDSLGGFPPSFVDSVPTCGSSNAPASNVSGLAWSALILPFVEQGNLWDRLGEATANFTVNWQSVGPAVDDLARTPLAAFECSSNPGAGTPTSRFYTGGRSFGRTNYGANSGTTATRLGSASTGEQCLEQQFGFPAADAAREWKTGVGVLNVSDNPVHVSPAGIRDGLSNTMLLAERSSTPESGGASCGGLPCAPSGGIWIGPPLIPTWAGWATGLVMHDVETYGGGNDWYMINRSTADWADDWINGSPHAGGGMNASMCDGSVRWISENIALETYRRLRSRMEGQPVADF